MLHTFECKKVFKTYFCQAQGPTQGPTKGQCQGQGQDMFRSGQVWSDSLQLQLQKRLTQSGQPKMNSGLPQENLITSGCPHSNPRMTSEDLWITSEWCLGDLKITSVMDSGWPELDTEVISTCYYYSFYIFLIVASVFVSISRGSGWSKNCVWLDIV